MRRFASGSWLGSSHLGSLFTMLRTSFHPTIAHLGTLGRFSFATRRLTAPHATVQHPRLDSHGRSDAKKPLSARDCRMRRRFGRTTGSCANARSDAHAP